MTTQLISGLLRAAINGGMLALVCSLITGLPLVFTLPAFVALRALVVTPQGVLGAFSSDDLADFATAFGNYYRPGGQNVSRLKQLMRRDTRGFDDQFTIMPVDGDILEFGLVADGHVLQPFKPVWSQTGDVSAQPRKLTLRRVKINSGTIPDHLVNTWLGFLADAEGKDPNVNRATWPFVRWYVEKYLLPMAMEDQYMEAFYGVWADPGTNSTPGAHGTSLDGICVEVNKDIDAGNINPIPTGALEEDPEAFVEQMNAFGEAIDDRYRGMPLVINMHDLYAQRFKQGLQEMNMLTPNEIKTTDMVALPLRTNIKVKGHFNWILGEGGDPSQKLLCAPAGELVKLVRTANKEGAAPRLEQVDYLLKFFTDWHVAYGVFDPRVCFTNDQDLEYGID